MTGTGWKMHGPDALPSVSASGDPAPPRPDAHALPVSPWVVRGEAVSALRDADGIRAEARQEAERLLTEAVRAAHILRDEARREGVAQSVAEAGRLLGDAADAVRTFRRDVEEELVPLAFAIAHRILGAFPEEERLSRAVRTALDEHRHTSGLRLRADPAAAAALRKALDATAQGNAVTVEIDENARPGGCTLIHPRGRTAVGPIDQLRSLFAASGAGGA